MMNNLILGIVICIALIILFILLRKIVYDIIAFSDIEAEEEKAPAVSMDTDKESNRLV